MVGLLFLFRVNVLRAIGSFLIDQDKPVKVEYAFILGGNIMDRSIKAKQLWEEGYIDHIVCLGNNVPEQHLKLGMQVPDAIRCRRFLWNMGVDSSRVHSLIEGTSTIEEVIEILQFSKTHGLDTIMVISDEFHTARIRKTFKMKQEAGDPEVVLIGAPSAMYSEENWWQNEAGLIMVNNEYIKTMYYALKY